MIYEAENTLYKLTTPIDVPLRFHRDGYLRIACEAICAKCGKSFKQILRTHRYLNSIGMAIPVRKPDPNDERVMSSLMLAACRNGVGKPRLHAAGCPVGEMPSGKFLLADIKSNRSGYGKRGRS